MLWGLGVGGEIQLKITRSLTHSLCQTINLCIKPGLNTFFPYLPSLASLSHCSKSFHCLSVRIWGEVERRKYIQTTLAGSKWRPVPLKRDGCLVPNLIGTYLCGAKNGKKTCYRIFDCREIGVEVLEVTITWTIRAWRSSLYLRCWQTRTHCWGHIVAHNVSWARKRAGHKMNSLFPCCANWETFPGQHRARNANLINKDGGGR